MERADVRDFLMNDRDIPVVDVRSPAEFAEGHITGARNIPLFSNEERAIIGTTYKQVGRDEAIEQGLGIVGPKMLELALEAKKLAVDNRLKVHCWRGGMRSEKMAWLFELVGLSTVVLNGGYKAYRRQLMEDFGALEHLIVLQGPTGSGKTMILKELQKRGEQILDLEYRANHKGSAFGSLGLGPQPTTAQFQNDLYADLLKLDISRRIWVESESLSIGRVYLPKTLWEAMNRSPVIEINVDKRIRAKRIVAEYGVQDKALLAESIEKIRNRFGGDRVKKALELLSEDRMEECVLLLLDYYDKTYEFSKNKYKKKALATLETQAGDPEKNALKIIEKANELKL